MPASKLQILLADDERVLRQALTARLSGAGYGVRAARDGEEALALFRAEKPDLVLLDVMMPRLSGYEACRRIRETDADVPILFLTALEAEADQLRGLGVGADDYIFKTAPDAVLLARIAAALRRARAAPPDGDFDFGTWRVEARKLEMRRASGERTPLKERELAILRLLAEHPGEVFSRDFLVTRFWGVDADITDNALSVYLFGLREKLKDEGRALETVRGVGYAYRPH